MVLGLFKVLVNQAGITAILAIIISQSKNVRKILAKRERRVREQIILVAFFSAFGIASTYMGVPVHGAIANSRVVGVFVAGLIGGPVVGLASGIIAGFHRWVIDIGGFTAFACMLSTILEGLLGGLLRSRLQRVREKWLFAMIAGAAAEMMQMLIILAVVRPFDEALDLVSIIAMPMIIANSIGIGIFIAIFDGVRKEFDRVAANQAEIVLNIANVTQKYFRKGYNRDTALATARIVLDNTDLDAVAFTDLEMIIAHVGYGSDHHRYGRAFQSDICRKAIRQKKILTADSKDQINCSDPSCPLHSAVLVPLFLGDEVIGTMKLYRKDPGAIKPVDIKLAQGLGSLFSTQIELSKLEEQMKLADQSELKALQAQINPHFLFNALNTIGSLIRTEPDSARELLHHLSLFFRNSFQSDREEVSIHKEIEHIRSYLEIEKARFGDKLHVFFNIPDTVDCSIPPFLLQPIVENAVKHGIMVRRNGGRIKVSAKPDRKGTLITVKDNGVGIDKEKLDSLFDSGESGNSALRNIQKRLYLKYGSTAGLYINSRSGFGTSVTIRIPQV